MKIDEIKEILLEENEIKKIIKKKAKEINQYYDNKNKPVVLCSLKDSIVLLSELVIRLDFDFKYEFIEIIDKSKKNYDKNNFNWITKSPLKNKNILIVDYIMKSGKNISNIQKYLKEEKGVKDIKIITLTKVSSKNNFAKPDWTILEVAEGEKVFGWGIQYQEQFRNLPYIASLKDEYK